MREPESDRERFVTQLTGCQKRLYAYILTAVARRADADEVLQNANLVLWRKADEYEPGTDFIGWAMRVAYYEILAWRQTRARDRHVFDDALTETLAAESASDSATLDARRAALDGCLAQLGDEGRSLIRLRYDEGVGVNAIAERQGKAPNAVSKVLHRLRTTLLKCIRGRMGEGGAA